MARAAGTSTAPRPPETDSNPRSPLDGINSSIWEFNPAIDPAGTTLVFTSISRPGDSGLGDLFVATLDREAWSEPQPLAINTPADEYHASRSPDGETLYVVRRTTDGDLYETPWESPP